MIDFNNMKFGSISSDKSVDLSLFEGKNLDLWIKFICNAHLKFPNLKFISNYFIHEFNVNENLDVFVNWQIDSSDSENIKIHFFNVIVFQKDKVTDEILDLISSYNAEKI